MAQLNLFDHAARHYHEAVKRLGRLDLAGCRASLENHRREFPMGADPAPVQEAAVWLERRLPHPEAEPKSFGRSALALCRAVREGRAGLSLLAPGGDPARNVVRALSRRALERMREAGLPPSETLDEGLPWAVFHLWAGGFAEARSALVAYQQADEPTALAYLALGDALWASGWGGDAFCAYREGYGLDPSGAGWAPLSPSLAGLRVKFANDPLFAGQWWAVGAYLEDGFPAYDRADPALVAKRWRRFAKMREAWRSGEGSEPVLFFAGLFLSEHGSLLPDGDLVLVRQTLREIKPPVYEIHLERLEDRVPPAQVGGKLYIGW